MISPVPIRAPANSANVLMTQTCTIKFKGPCLPLAFRVPHTLQGTFHGDRGNRSGARFAMALVARRSARRNIAEARYASGHISQRASRSYKYAPRRIPGARNAPRGALDRPLGAFGLIWRPSAPANLQLCPPLGHSTSQIPVLCCTCTLPCQSSRLGGPVKNKYFSFLWHKHKSCAWLHLHALTPVHQAGRSCQKLIPVRRFLSLAQT